MRLGNRDSGFGIQVYIIFLHQFIISNEEPKKQEKRKTRIEEAQTQTHNTHKKYICRMLNYDKYASRTTICIILFSAFFLCISPITLPVLAAVAISAVLAVSAVVVHHT